MFNKKKRKRDKITKNDRVNTTGNRQLNLRNIKWMKINLQEVLTKICRKFSEETEIVQSTKNA